MAQMAGHTCEKGGNPGSEFPARLSLPLPIPGSWQVLKGQHHWEHTHTCRFMFALRQ